jgi:MFS family permease
MVGQVAFGFAADILGRRKMYGLELVIVIVGTMLFIMSSTGAMNSMSVGGWMITWRAVSQARFYTTKVLANSSPNLGDGARNRCRLSP